MIFKIPNNILLKKVFVVFIYDTNILLSAIPGRTIPLSNIISPALVIGILAQCSGAYCKNLPRSGQIGTLSFICTYEFIFWGLVLV